MSETLIQTYLNNQFIKTSEEGNITNLQKVAKVVAEKLRKKKARIIPYTLAAIDPHILENDPVILEVEKLITGKWKTFKNSVAQTNEKSTTYIRVVILDALRLLSNDEEYAAMIWHTSRDIVSFYQLGSEREIIKSMLLSIGNQVEKDAQFLWGIQNQVSLPNLSISKIETNPKIASKDYLIKRLKAAAGPTRMEDGTNTPNDKANRYWANSNQNWATDFGDIAGSAIVESINSVLENQNESIENFVNKINISLQGLTPFFEQMNDAVLNRVKSANKRNDLLWWKQTLYSPNLDKSYRGLKPINAAIVMLIDLARMVNPIYPRSIDFLLKETLKDLHGEQIDESKPLTDWISQIMQLEENEKALLQIFSSKEKGRKSLGDALANSINEDSEVDVFYETGISKKVEISLADLAVWIFHDLQAAKIAQTK